jgi:hypothetical protein
LVVHIVLVFIVHIVLVFIVEVFIGVVLHHSMQLGKIVLLGETKG